MDESALIAVAVTIAFALFVGWSVRREKRQAEVTWGQIANRYGLDRDGWSLSGEVDGVQIEIERIVRHRQGTEIVVIIEVAIPDPRDVPRGLRVARKTLLDSFKDSFRGNDIEVGRSELDERFVFQAQNEKELLDWLTESVIRALEGLDEHELPYLVKREKITVEVFWLVVRKEEVMTLLIESLLAAAEAFAGRGEGTRAGGGR